MRSLKLIIASNGLAIFLTVVFLLPIVAIVAYIATSPLDDALGRLGLAMRNFGAGVQMNLTLWSGL